MLPSLDGSVSPFQEIHSRRHKIDALLMTRWNPTVAAALTHFRTPARFDRYRC
jgi:hypothetical protein